MATTTKELSTQLEDVTSRLRALESGQHVMTSSPGLPLEKWNDHGFVHRHEIKPLVRAINNGGGSAGELEDRVETLESSMTSAQNSISGLNSGVGTLYGALVANTNYANFAAIPASSLGVFTVGGATSAIIEDAPYPSYRGLWTVRQHGVPNFLFQEATQMLTGFNGYREIWRRSQNNGTWSEWFSGVRGLNSAKYLDNWGSNDLVSTYSQSQHCFVTPLTVSSSRKLDCYFDLTLECGFQLNAPAGLYDIRAFKPGVVLESRILIPIMFIATNKPPIIKWGIPRYINSGTDDAKYTIALYWTAEDTAAVADYGVGSKIIISSRTRMTIDLTLF